MMLRTSARLLILDDHGRLLLSLCQDERLENPDPFWATLGGGVEPGETLEQAAIREAKEETGRDATLGPTVWYMDHTLIISGIPLRLQETFFVVRLEDGPFSRAAWTDEERAIMLDLRWWTLDEIITTKDRIFPSSLSRYLPDVLLENYPSEPIVIEP